MNALKFFLLLLATGIMASAAEIKMLRMTVNSISVEELFFAIETIEVNGKDVISAEVMGDNKRQLKLAAKKIGIAEVQANGSGMSQKFRVVVNNDLSERLEELRSDLDEFPELRVKISNHQLKVEGKINSLKKKRTLDKIFKAYGDVIWNMTSFSILPEAIIKLKKEFSEAGYPVIDSKEKAEVGELFIKVDDDKIFISGQIYSTEDEKRIRAILDGVPWLVNQQSKRQNAANGFEDDRVSYSLNLQVVESILQVDVLHIAVTEADCKRIGIDWGSFFENGVSVTAELFKEVIHDPRPNAPLGQNGHYAGSSLKINAGLAATLGLMGKNDISRIRRSASMTFKSNGKAKMHNGGTVEINNTNTSGNNMVADTKTIDYGLQLEVSGGLTGKDTVNLEITQSVSYPVQPDYDSVAFEQKKSSFAMPLKFKLDEAIAIGSMRDITQEIKNTASLPYVRNIPFLKWLVSQSGDDYDETRIITLVSVRQFDSHSTIDPVANQLEAMHLEDDARQHEHDDKKEIEKEKEKNAPWYQFWKW